MATQTFTERINITNAKYLLSIPHDDLLSMFDFADNEDENGAEKFWKSPEVYVREMKNWLRTAIKEMEKNGHIKTKYKHAMNSIDAGRIFVSGFGIQKLKKTIRGFLIKDFVNDYDMVNAHPAILYGIIKHKFPEMKDQFPNFRDYVKQRKLWIDSYKVSKLEVLVALNSGKQIKTDNQHLARLDKELKAIQKLIWGKYHEVEKVPATILSRKGDLKQNKFGRYINMIMCDKENEILQEVMSVFKAETPMFDGFTLDKSFPVDETIQKLNEMTHKKYGVKWSNKEHDNKIQIDEGVEISFENIPFYEDQKAIFEKTHFIIESPLMFGRLYEIDGEKKYQLYKKVDFRDLVKPVKYWEIDEDGTGYGAEFFPKWLEDPSHKSYREMGFKPTLEENPNVFNSFSGFQYQQTMTYEECKESAETDPEFQEVIKIFGSHLYHLCGRDEKGAEYLWNYIAHMFQKPHILPEVAVILKSKQGHGKDTLVNILEKMIAGYVFRTADMDDIFGNFNVGIRDKILIQLNEVEGKDGFSKKEKLKNIITETETIIREKHVSIYKQKNYKRVFIFSNNLNPIEISHDDRRFVVFQAHYEKPDKEYFDDLYSICEPEKLQMLFDYLMNYDISKFKITDRPLTQAYNNMKEHNVNPLYKFIWKMFVDDEWEKTFEPTGCYKKKTGDIVLANPTSLFQTYVNYLNCEDMGFIKPTFKIVSAVLADIGVLKKSVRIGQNIRGDYYIMKKDELKERLASYKFDEECLEFDEDDFEIE